MDDRLRVFSSPAGYMCHLERVQLWRRMGTEDLRPGNILSEDGERARGSVMYVLLSADG